MVDTSTFSAVWLSVKLAFITSLFLLIFVTPLAWRLAHWEHKLKSVVLAILALPLVLPPTVLGFYLLVAFSPDSVLGSSWQTLTGRQLVFSFEGLILGSFIYSLPFALQPLYSGFTQLDKRYIKVAYSLGYGKIETFFKIVLPLCKVPLIVALTLSFAHTIGEFGVVLMIGGNIPGETQVLSIALYDHVEALEYGQAHILSFGLLVFSFILLTLLYRFNSKGGLNWTSLSR